MFALPSMWSLIVSTVVFFVAAWYIHRYLEEQGIPKGMTRGLLVFVLASVLSWGSGEVVDRIQGVQPAAQTSQDLSQLLKAAGRAQP
jgi:membrane protein required for beta-lactamase induction